jgi:hypothetical protein
MMSKVDVADEMGVLNKHLLVLFDVEGGHR